MRRSRPDGPHGRRLVRAGLLVFATLLALVSASPAQPQSTAVPGTPTITIAPTGPPDPNQPPPGTILLLLPAISRDGDWIAPWTNPSEAARFAKLEQDLATRWKALGYGVMTFRQALAIPSANAALKDSPRPITPEAAASVARAAQATLAFVLRAEALRRKEPKATFTDALVSVEVCRAADAVKLAWANMRVSGTGPTEADADAAALSQAAERLVDSLAQPLLAAVRRPIIAPRPFAILIEGDLTWRDYRRLLALLQHEIPEIRELEERRFSHGRQTLRAVCACQPWDITQRLDGRSTGGFTFSVRSETDAVRVQARPAGPAGIPP